MKRIACFLIAASLYSADPSWHRATVAAVDAMPGNAMQMRYSAARYTIRSGEQEWVALQWGRTVWGGVPAAFLKTGDSILIAPKKNKIRIKDSTGKEHKLDLESTTELATQKIR